MLGVFPALTESFVLREIRAVRQRGIDVVICAARRPVGGEDMVRARPAVAEAEHYYARPDRVVSHAFANLLTLIQRPVRYCSALRRFIRAGMGLPGAEARQLLYHFFAGVGFGRDLARQGVRHLHCHFTSGANMALAANLVGDTSFSFTAHASDDLFVRPLLLDDKTERARFVAAVCEYSRRYLDSVTGYRYSSKLHRVYNGVERRDARAARPETQTPRIVSVGSLLAPKGHATLIQACAALRARGCEFRCRIVGEGPDRPILERLIRDLGLEGRVELTGALPLEAVYREMDQADIFALLCEIGPRGYRDGFPTVVLEAMAAELPVVATTISGLPEMVIDGVSGLLVRERDVESAALALERLVESADLRRSMGGAGGARVRASFDIDQSAGTLAALLKQAAE